MHISLNYLINIIAIIALLFKPYFRATCRYKIGFGLRLFDSESSYVMFANGSGTLEKWPLIEGRGGVTILLRLLINSCNSNAPEFVCALLKTFSAFPEFQSIVKFMVQPIARYFKEHIISCNNHRQFYGNCL